METLFEMMIVLVTAGLMGALIGVFYKFSHSRAVYASKMIISLIMYSVLAAMMLYLRITVSAASVIGAAIIIRFRNPIKDHRDIVYILWAVIAGFCTATGSYLILGLVSVLLAIVFLYLDVFKKRARVLIAIKGYGDKNDDILNGLKSISDFEKLNLLKDNSVEHSTLELIYEVKEKKEGFLLAGKIKDEIYQKIPEIKEVSVSYQADDMSI